MEALHVEAARIPDRDRLLQLLVEQGLDARSVDEIGIEIPCEDAEIAGNDVLAEVEHVIFQIGAPFVPLKHEGVIYVRPPVS